MTNLCPRPSHIIPMEIQRNETLPHSPFFISFSFLKIFPVSSMIMASPFSHRHSTDAPGFAASTTARRTPAIPKKKLKYKFSWIYNHKSNTQRENPRCFPHIPALNLDGKCVNGVLIWIFGNFWGIFLENGFGKREPHAPKFLWEKSELQEQVWG